MRRFAACLLAGTAYTFIATPAIAQDEHPRFDATLDSMAKLPPVFRKGGSVHAGNSSGVTDGASSMLVASGEAVAKHNLKPMARIVGIADHTPNHPHAHFDDFSSYHVAGVHFLLGDGSVRRIDDSIDFQVYQGLCTIDGREPVQAP